MVKAFIALCVLIALVAGALALNRTEAQSPAPFDHSGCQYPDRTTNPAFGCDNSDPCDPANVKGGSGDCVDIVEPKVNETVKSVDVEPAPLMEGK